MSEVWDNLHFPCFQWLEWSALLNQTSAYFPDRLSLSPYRLISRLLNLNSYLPTSLTFTLLWWTRFPSVRSGFIDADAGADADADADAAADADVDVVIVVEIIGGVDDADIDDNIDIGSVSRESAHLYSGTLAKKKLAKRPVLEDLCSWKKNISILLANLRL